MSDSFLSLYGRELEAAHDGPIPTLATREEVFRALHTFKQVDLVIIGGGLSGVTLARAATLQGSDVLLIEPGYFGERSSSWPDIIASALTRNPGAIARSLRTLNVVTTEVAPHLVTDKRWQDDVPRSVFGRFASWLAQRAWGGRSATQTDRVIPGVDERLLIRETALAARQEGALVVSAATAAYVERDAAAGGFRVGVKDLLTEERVEISATSLFIDPIFPHPVASRIGTPIVRRSLPLATSVSVVCAVTQRGDTQGMAPRYRSVVLHDGSLGSLFERAPGIVVVGVEAEMPTSELVTQRVQQVCAVCGYQVTEEVSRRSHGRAFDADSRVVHHGGVLVTRERVPWDIFSLSPKILSKVSSCGTARQHRRPLSGEWRDNERERFIAAAKCAGRSESTIKMVIDRWQGRVRYIPLVKNGFDEVCPGVLLGEISLAVLSDQVSSLEDLIFGSLALHTVPGWRSLVPALTQALSPYIPGQAAKA